MRKEKGNPIIDINYAINGRSLNDIIITDCYRGEIWASVPETSLLSMEIETFGFACFFNFLRILNFLLNNFLMK